MIFSEGPDEYEKDDFIVDDVDEEEEQEEEEDRADSDEERQRKKKRKKKWIFYTLSFSLSKICEAFHCEMSGNKKSGTCSVFYVTWDYWNYAVTEENWISLL